MALQDILQKIRSDGAADILVIEDARDAELAKISSQQASYVAERTASAKVDTERRAQKIGERILAKARHQVQFIAGSAEQAKLESAFSNIESELVTLKDDEYENFLASQFMNLSSTGAGSFIVAKERSEKTTAFLVAKGIEATAITTEAESYLLGGFVFLTQKQEFDCSFRGLLQNIRDHHAVDIAHKLAN